jgi:hypothetical protein
MRLGASDADAYLQGWTRSDWVSHPGTPVDTCEKVVADLESEWTPEQVAAYLDAIGPAAS